jgi:hypothetical protein
MTAVTFYVTVWMSLALQATQPSSLKLVSRLLDEVKTFKPTLAINNGDISYARLGTRPSKA